MAIHLMTLRALKIFFLKFVYNFSKILNNSDDFLNTFSFKELDQSNE